jgi:hypothetical protein
MAVPAVSRGALDGAPTELDELVAQICVTLQISPTQFELAERHYRAVGDWLAGDGSPIATLQPIIYPQGSMALRTTVKPREREEYDLDLVLQVEPTTTDPMRLYNLVADRLEAHGTYGLMLERMKRCLRLSYEHDFHLDILPARRDRLRGTTCIEVPDRKLEGWHPSNPVGYVAWFEHRCDETSRAKAEREQVPLPVPLLESQLTVLRQVVQLLKRRRDNAFGNSDIAPRSVVLTTLAGHAYVGTDSLTGAVEQVLGNLALAVEQAYPAMIEVRNPTNPAELFSEAWRNNPEAYRAFVTWLRGFHAEIVTLRATEGIDAIGTQLDRMFGDNLGARAVRAYSERRAAAARAGILRYGTPGIIVGATEGRVVPRNTFHHGTT